MTMFAKIRDAAVCLVVVVLASCTTVAGVTTFDDPVCRGQMKGAIADVLRVQGETQNVEEIANQTVAALPALGPRPFLVMAPSGTDYSFIVQQRDEGCALRLYAKEKGFTSYVNNMNFIETRLIDRCECSS
jgi:hypothetical protein